MNSINLKLTTEKDIPIFLEIEKSLGDFKFYSRMDDKNEARNEFKKNIVHLIQMDNEIVGIVEYEIKNKDHAYLSGLIINPKFQGKGVRKEVMNQVMEKLKFFKRVDLVTHPENIKALNLYKSFGFVFESRIENYFGNGEPRVVLVRKN